jgi:hypothetical protein
VLELWVRGELSIQTIKEHLVGLGVVDLMSGTLCSRINTSKGNART